MAANTPARERDGTVVHPVPPLPLTRRTSLRSLSALILQQQQQANSRTPSPVSPLPKFCAAAGSPLPPQPRSTSPDSAGSSPLFRSRARSNAHRMGGLSLLNSNNNSHHHHHTDTDPGTAARTQGHLPQLATGQTACDGSSSTAAPHVVTRSLSPVSSPSAARGRPSTTSTPSVRIPGRRAPRSTLERDALWGLRAMSLPSMSASVHSGTDVLESSSVPRGRRKPPRRRRRECKSVDESGHEFTFHQSLPQKPFALVEVERERRLSMANSGGCHSPGRTPVKHRCVTKLVTLEAGTADAGQPLCSSAQPTVSSRARSLSDPSCGHGRTPSLGLRHKLVPVQRNRGWYEMNNSPSEGDIIVECATADGTVVHL